MKQYSFLEEILSESEHVFDDVSDEFGRCKRVKRIFEQWKSEQSETYAEAYIEICLPKLFSPIIRLEMIDWKPFEVRRVMKMFKEINNLTTF